MPKPAIDRPLYFSAFVMNTPSHVIHGLWRDETAANHEINSLKHWVDLARSGGVGAVRFGCHLSMIHCLGGFMRPHSLGLIASLYRGRHAAYVSRCIAAA